MFEVDVSSQQQLLSNDTMEVPKSGLAAIAPDTGRADAQRTILASPNGGSTPTLPRTVSAFDLAIRALVLPQETLDHLH
jgi:hypothetical protein